MEVFIWKQWRLNIEQTFMHAKLTFSRALLSSCQIVSRLPLKLGGVPKCFNAALNVSVRLASIENNKCIC